MAEVVIADYGVGNIYSIARAIEFCGHKPVLSSDPVQVNQARKIILPGVGAFPSGIKQLRASGLDEAIIDAARKQTPVLGICLGMQFLLDESHEFGVTEGLGLIPGIVKSIPHHDPLGMTIKVPHIGWGDLEFGFDASISGHMLMKDVSEYSAVYFVHSFMAYPKNPAHLIAKCSYGGRDITAIVGFENVWGVQFHPEKSGRVGLKILNNFLKL